MIRVVFLDAEGTFIRFKPSLSEIYKALWSSYGVTLNNDDWGTKLREAYRDIFQIKLSPPLNGDICQRAWKEVFDLVFGQLKDKPFYEEVFQRAYQFFALPECVELMPGFMEFLEKVKISGIKTAVISNWDCRLYSVLEGHDLLRKFEALFIGCEVGYLKPHQAIFERALDYFKVSPREALMIGDSLHDDIIPAQNMGMKAFHVGENPDYKEILRYLKLS